ncbi:MAG: glycosyltransferase [Fuerstiella sp.]
MFSTVLAGVVGILLAGHVAGLILLIRNRRWMAWSAEQRSRPTGQHSITVIVPARNESRDIGTCLESLLAQDYPKLQIVAVNDHSDDDTGSVMDQLAARDDRLTVIHHPVLKPGWLGKHNAMQAAYERTDADFILLTDADVEFAPGCLSAAIAEAEVRSLDMLSLCPRFSYATFCETMLLPIYVGGAAFLLSPAIEDPESPHAMAIGAFILVRGERLREVNGLEQIRARILDDVSLAELFKQRGWRISLRAAPDLMHVRLFKSNRHAFFGATKHLLGLVQNAIWLAPLLALVPALMYGILLFAAGYGFRHGYYVTAGLACVTLILHYSALLMTRPENRFNPILALAFPCLAIQFAASCLMAVYSLVVKRTFRWRGRNTNLGTESAKKLEAVETAPPG